MNSEKLIEFVKKYAFLYDLNDIRYTDKLKKDAAWKEIAGKLKVNEKECKKAWCLLRDAFRRAIKKQRETEREKSSVPSKKWKYEEEMSFLLPHFKKGSTTLCTVTTEDEDNYYDETDMDDEGPAHYPFDEESTDNNQSQSSAATSSTPMIPFKRLRRTAEKPKSEEIPSAALMEYILQEKEKTDDVEQFFASIATTVKSFPLKDRAIAKAKVFQAISKMELEILSRPWSISTDDHSFISVGSGDAHNCRSLSPSPSETDINAH